MIEPEPDSVRYCPHCQAKTWHHGWVCEWSDTHKPARPINLERLHEATDAQLAEAHAAALAKAHDAPVEMRGDPPIINGSMAWARFSREANRIGDEIARRRR